MEPTEENKNFQPVFDQNQQNQEQEVEKKKRFTTVDYALIALVVYFFISIFAAVIYVKYAESNVYKLSQLATSNINKGTKAIDLPICLPKNNSTALRSSILENTYSGTVKEIDDSLASSSASYYGSITLGLPGSNSFTYYIDKKDQSKVNFIDDVKFTEERGTISPINPGDRINIVETLRLNRSTLDTKSGIEITRF